jgi:hypothetical protein
MFWYILNPWFIHVVCSCAISAHFACPFYSKGWWSVLVLAWHELRDSFIHPYVLRWHIIVSDLKSALFKIMMKQVFNNIARKFTLSMSFNCHCSLFMTFEWIIFLFSFKWKLPITLIHHSIMMNRLYVMYVWKLMLVTLAVTGHILIMAATTSMLFSFKITFWCYIILVI